MPSMRQAETSYHGEGWCKDRLVNGNQHAIEDNRTALSALSRDTIPRPPNGHSALNITELVTKHNWQFACIIVDTLHALQLQDWITHNDGLIFLYSTPQDMKGAHTCPHMIGCTNAPGTCSILARLMVRSHNEIRIASPEFEVWQSCGVFYAHSSVLAGFIFFFSFWATSPVQVSSNLSCDNQRVVGSLPWQAPATLSVQLGAVTHTMTHSNIHVLNPRCSKYSSKGIMYVAGTSPCPTIVLAFSSPKKWHSTFNEHRVNIPTSLPLPAIWLEANQLTTSIPVCGGPMTWQFVKVLVSRVGYRWD